MVWSSHEIIRSKTHNVELCVNAFHRGEQGMKYVQAVTPSIAPKSEGGTITYTNRRGSSDKPLRWKSKLYKCSIRYFWCDRVRHIAENGKLMNTFWHNSKWRKCCREDDDTFPVHEQRSGHVSAMNWSNKSSEYHASIIMIHSDESEHPVIYQSLFQCIDQTDHVTLKLVNGSTVGAKALDTVIV